MYYMCETCVLQVFYTCITDVIHKTCVACVSHMQCTCGTFGSVT